MKSSKRKIWSCRTHMGIFLSFFVGFSRVWCCCVSLAIEFVLRCVQIVILGLYTIVAHLPRFLPKLIAKNSSSCRLSLRKGKFPLILSWCMAWSRPWAKSNNWRLRSTQNASLGWLLKQPTNKFKVSSTPSNSC